MNEKNLHEMAVKTAFFNMDFCPGTSLYEVLDQDALDVVAKDAEDLLASIQVHEWYAVDRYVVASVLWDMEPEELDIELSDYDD